MSKFFKEVLRDGSKGSFGRTTALPFLMSVWILLSVHGAMLVYEGTANTEDIISVTWKLFLVAGSLYGGSKGLTAIRDAALRGKDE